MLEGGGVHVVCMAWRMYTVRVSLCCVCVYPGPINPFLDSSMVNLLVILSSSVVCDKNLMNG